MPKRNRAAAFRGIVASAALLSLALPTTANEGIIYRYDVVGHIASALYDSGVCIAYTYDANGNRVTQITAVSASPPTWGSIAWGCFRWTAP